MHFWRVWSAHNDMFLKSAYSIFKSTERIPIKFGIWCSIKIVAWI